ncbi:MAG: hypothetical protein F6K65_08145 [Moorea sp. SIO3C2]|nr:hypothetical protein [Moorena sp. SIO3C2]
MLLKISKIVHDLFKKAIAILRVMSDIAYPFKAKGMHAKGNSKEGFNRCIATP